jgi:hypothetical protein
MTTPWEYLIQGDLIKAAYETYNQPFAFHGVYGYPIGFLFIVFMIVMYIQNRDIRFNFVVSLITFAFVFAFIPPLMQGIIAMILVFELGGTIYDWVVKEQ